MKITNLGVANTPLPSQPQVDAGGATGGGEPAPKPGAVKMPGATPHHRNWCAWSTSSSSCPAFAGDHVQETAARRLARRSYYHTQASIESTAAAMLNTPE